MNEYFAIWFGEVGLTKVLISSFWWSLCGAATVSSAVYNIQSVNFIRWYEQLGFALGQGLLLGGVGWFAAMVFVDISGVVGEPSNQELIKEVQGGFGKIAPSFVLAYVGGLGGFVFAHSSNRRLLLSYVGRWRLEDKAKGIALPGLAEVRCIEVNGQLRVEGLNAEENPVRSGEIEIGRTDLGLRWDDVGEKWLLRTNMYTPHVMEIIVDGGRRKVKASNEEESAES